MSVRKLLAYAAIYLLWSGSFLAIRELVSPALQGSALQGSGLHGSRPPATGYTLPAPGSRPPAAGAIPPFFAAAFRFTAAGALLLLWKRLREPAPLHARQLLSAILLGLIMFVGDYACLFWAEIRVPSGIAAVISALIPIWVFAGEVFLLRTLRPTLVALAGIALGFIGIVVLSVRSGSGPGSAPAGAHVPPLSTIAVLVLIAGTLCWSLGTLLSRRLTLPQPQKANAGWQMFSGGLILFALSAAAGEFRRLPPPHVLFSARFVVSMAYLVIAASIVSYSAYVWLIHHDSPTRVASYAYVNPVFALILGALLAGERLTSVQIAGCALVVAGVFATLKGRGATQPAQRSAATSLDESANVAIDAADRS